MLSTDGVAEAFGPGSHASTFGGTPLVTAVALRALEIISQPVFLRRVQRMGAYLYTCLQQLRDRYSLVRDVRGRGLLLGMELTIPGQDLVKRCLEEGIVINCVQENVLRFVPPLTIETNEVDRLIQVLDEILREKAA
jgi:acetylornithine aminotransferase